MGSGVALLVLAWFAASPAAAQTLSPQQPGTSLSPQIAAIISDWKAFYAEAKAQYAASPPASIAEALDRRVLLDQGVRNATMRVDLSGSDQQSLMQALGPDIVAIDADDTAYVKAVLPPDGWFRKSRDGERVAHNAWLIVQHSPDQAFQKQVLAAMEPLAKTGEVAGPDYALLFDRTALHDGKAQRYGSQGICEDHHIVIAKIEDAKHVDALRREIGLTESLADYSRRLGVGRPC